ncbi:DUF2637 domain-containing protein [Streptomyces erythrochromogenes]|uniref:DUF2637 domain-containing protein n=1 Tax=Streptomyces erythrochromogenes TaxID=285574 RepID=UPI0038014F34
MAQPELTRTHRLLIGVVTAGAVIIAGIGFAGSYTAVRALAMEKGFGAFSLVFPIGIDAGICVLLALDLLLTRMRIPFPLLRQTAWLLTAATIAFNGAASWPDPLGVGMHAVIPVLFVVTVEAARHAVGRIADITADRHMEGVRITRWILSPAPTFKLWRRMKLWELRSYEQAIGMEQDRLIYQTQLQARYGRAWRRKAPVEALMPLRLARLGVPLSQTTPEGLAAAGIKPAGLSPQPTSAVPPSENQADHLPTAPAAQAVAAAAEPAARAMQTRGVAPPSVAGEMDLATAGQPLIQRRSASPGNEQFAAFPAQDRAVTDPVPGRPMPDGNVEPRLADLAPPRAEGEPSPIEKQLTNEGLAPTGSHATRVTAVPQAVPTSSAVTAVVTPSRLSTPVTPTTGASQSAAMGTGTATALLPEQQTAELEQDPVHEQIVTVAQWLAEAEEIDVRLSGAEVGRRLGLSPRTGQRRLDKAAQHLAEQRRQQGRAHLRPVRT